MSSASSEDLNTSSSTQAPCNGFLQFGLIVTGEAERDHLPKLFRTLRDTGVCTFRVVPISDYATYIGQRRPITSDTRKAKMVGSGEIIPEEDEKIGLAARRHLQSDPCRLLILIDDLEHDWREQAQEVFARYRLILYTILNENQRRRASVHLLVNMLEAYYFADAKTVNAVLSPEPPLEDYSGDVEDIPNPKGKLKGLRRGFDEKEGGGKILSQINVEHILSRAETCAWLRTLFAWCVKALEKQLYLDTSEFVEKFRLNDGILSEVTKGQLDNL